MTRCSKSSKHFCSVRLNDLKNLEPFINKTLTFAGIVTNVQYKTAKNGKDWGMFTLEGFDETHDFRMFDEEYLKFRHFLSGNRFLYFKCNVREGWLNKETGKRTEPRIQFLEVKQLQDVLSTQAKKITLNLNIKELQNDTIHQLSRVFQANKGEHSLSFEVLETQQVTKAIAPVKEIVSDEGLLDDEVLVQPEIEETKIVTRIAMPSRKVRININSSLLQELEKMDIRFRLN